MNARIAITGLTTIALPLVLSIYAASADHDQFEYKLPCAPSDACYLTTQDHTPGHSLDFDIGGSAFDGTVKAMAEGIVSDLRVDQTECTSSGLGMQVHVSDIFGRTTIYAHLASFADGLGFDSETIPCGARVQAARRCQE
jgi:hypothetical protein